VGHATFLQGCSTLGHERRSCPPTRLTWAVFPVHVPCRQRTKRTLRFELAREPNPSSPPASSRLPDNPRARLETAFYTWASSFAQLHPERSFVVDHLALLIGSIGLTAIVTIYYVFLRKRAEPKEQQPQQS